MAPLKKARRAWEVAPLNSKSLAADSSHAEYFAEGRDANARRGGVGAAIRRANSKALEEVAE